MKPTWILAVVIGVTASLAFAARVRSPWYNPSISAEAALRVAQAALQAAREKKMDAAIAVLDSTGRLLVFLRADRATEQFGEGAIQKAWTAVNLRASTGGTRREDFQWR